ncbi:MAG: hypothetical protein ACR2MB_01925 [Acidimicrobiales bacterium]
MNLDVKPGARFQSAVCDTQIAVVKTSAPEADLRCGGHPLLPMGADRADGAALEPGFDEGTLVGKRYVDADQTVEVLCTKPGAGSLSLGDARLELKEAKPLPSSD